MKRFYLSILIFSLLVGYTNAQTALNESDFKSPNTSTRVHTWWHWLNGSVTKDGITKDLESMKKQGISQVTIVDVMQGIEPQSDIPTIQFGTPKWYSMFQWSLQEADRLGLKMGIQNTPGWATSGGPWVEVDNSMKQYVWTKTVVEGNKNISIQLPMPQIKANYFRDVAVIAFPVINNENSYQLAKPRVLINKTVDASVLSDANPVSVLSIKKGDVIDITLSNELKASRIAFLPTLVFAWNMGGIINNFTLLSSRDGQEFTKIDDLSFKGVNSMLIVEFPETTSKYFRMECRSWKSECVISEFELLGENDKPSYSPAISDLMIKAHAIKYITEKQLDLTLANNEKGIAENSIINLTQLLTTDGKLNWKAPKGRWGIIRFGYSTTAKMNKPVSKIAEGFEIDKMDTTALNNYFRAYPDKLLKAAGKYAGNTFKFFLIDSWECFYQNWTASFADEFKKRRGYDITPWIPVLCGELVENTKISEGFIYDYKKTISDLIDQNYYKHFSTLCHRRNMELHAETGRGDYPQIDVLKSNQYFDMPMTEFWARQYGSSVPDYKPVEKPTEHFPAFAAFDGQKQIIGAEAYTGYAHYLEVPQSLKPYGDMVFCAGVNQLIFHSFVHQPSDKKPGLTLGDFGSTINRNNPWFEFSRGWMDYQSRIQSVLQKGEPIVDAVYYVGDQFPQSKTRSYNDDLPYGYTTYPCNFDMLKNRAKVVNGKLSFGGKQLYPLLTLPDKANMELATLKKIAQLVNDGAIVYGPKPLEMLGLLEMKNGIEFKELADKLWGTTNSSTLENKYGKGKVIWGKPIKNVLTDLGVIPDFTTTNLNPKNFMYIHKKLDDSDVYFVFNQQNKFLQSELIFRIEGKTPEIWNPENGTIALPAIYSVEQNQTHIPVTFKPMESMIFVFKNQKPDNFIKSVSHNGKQIFPKTLSQDNRSPIPSANYSKNVFEFSTESQGNYTFQTNKDLVMTKNLIQPTVLDIANFKGSISFLPISNETIQTVEISNLKSLTEFENPSIKYLAGKANYSISFDVPAGFASTKDSIILSLGELSATAEVFLNGKRLVYAWMPNTTIPVSNLLENNNNLEIHVATICGNRFIGDFIQFGDVKSLWTTSNVRKFLNNDTTLKPSGLIGPLKLIKYPKQ